VRSPRSFWCVRAAAAAPVLALAVAAFAASAPPDKNAVLAAPTRWVTDHAGFLSEATREALDRRLESVERSTGHQIVVWIGKSNGGQPIEDWAARAFQAWGVGRKKLDDGAAIFVLADDRKVRIEVGYGLEHRLTDLKAAQIIRERFLSRMQGRDRDGAVFVRRSLAAIATTAGALFLAVAIDRVALATHITKAEGARVSAVSRIAACNQASKTFFFRKTLGTRLKAISETESAPTEVRRAAQLALERARTPG